MTTVNTASRIRVRRIVLPVLLVVELALLYLLTGGALFHLTINHVSPPFSSGSLALLLLVGLPSIVAFIIPTAIGVLARTWQGAIVLAVAPWWLTLLLHAGTLLHAQAENPNQPAWLALGNAAFLLASLGLFAALGFLGWLARRIVPDEL